MTLSEYRMMIDDADRELLAAFRRRMEASAGIAACKQRQGLPVRDPLREQEKLDTIRALVGAELADYAAALYETLFALSRDYQTKLLAPKDEKALRCGLLGTPLGHSYSPAIHAMLGSYSYELFDTPETGLSDFLKRGEFDALNVTIPYKKAVIPFCAALSPEAEAVGSVNTILRRPDGTLFGDNTDCAGFRALVRESGVSVAGKKALVLGSGGASRTVCHVLRELNAREIVVISRTGENNYENLDRHADAELIVNATPVGMFPMNGEMLFSLTEFPDCAAVFDLVYNPARTALVLQAEHLGIPAFGGLRMLVEQACRSAELFTGRTVSEETAEQVLRTLRRKSENVILIGMPGSGKTTVAAALAEALGRQCLDADTIFADWTGMDIPSYFAVYGESGFRAQESDILLDLGRCSGCVISTGGGVVLNPMNYDTLHQNGTIIWLRRGLDRLAREGRPLSEHADLAAMYETRAPLYARFADFTVSNDGTVAETVQAILEVLE